MPLGHLFRRIILADNAAEIMNCGEDRVLSWFLVRGAGAIDLIIAAHLKFLAADSQITFNLEICDNRISHFLIKVK